MGLPAAAASSTQRVQEIDQPWAVVASVSGTQQLASPCMGQPCLAHRCIRHSAVQPGARTAWQLAAPQSPVLAAMGRWRLWWWVFLCQKQAVVAFLHTANPHCHVLGMVPLVWAAQTVAQQLVPLAWPLAAACSVQVVLLLAVRRSRRMSCHQAKLGGWGRCSPQVQQQLLHCMAPLGTVMPFVSSSSSVISPQPQLGRAARQHLSHHPQQQCVQPEGQEAVLQPPWRREQLTVALNLQASTTQQ
jgi:hypothetical protein